MRRLLARLVGVLIGLAMMGSGLYVHAVAVGFTSSISSLMPETARAPEYLVGATILEFVGFMILVLALGEEDRPARLVLRIPGEPGLKVTISEVALKRLLAWEAHRVDGVRALRTAVDRDDEGWRLECDVGVTRGTSFPAASTTLAQLFRESLELATGEPVHTITLNLELRDDDNARGLA